ncbi:MAG: HEAT repeat domain-containing protein [Pirellulales bacterium]
MPNQSKYLGLLVCGMIHMLLIAGCADGPFFEMKKANPYFRKQWEEDRALGPTFDDRMNEMQLLRSQISQMDAEEQRRWLESLEKIFANDPSPDMRRQVAMACATIQDPKAFMLLQKAAQDDSDKVRLAACKSLAKQNTSEALALIGKIATTDESTSVRVAAINAISNYEGEEAKRWLAKTIQDRSPSIQYQSTVSLAKVTGENLGGDVALWKRYLNGEAVEGPKATLADQMGSMLKLR